MVDLSLKDLSPAAIDIELVDPQAPPYRQSLYYRKARVPGYEVTAPLKFGLSWSTTLEAGERVWLFRAYPTRKFILRHRGGSPGRSSREASCSLPWAVQLENALAESRSTLASQVERLNLRNQEVQLLNEVGDMLQSCVSTEEAHPLISLHALRLLPEAPGPYTSMTRPRTCTAPWRSGGTDRRKSPRSRRKTAGLSGGGRSMR